MAVWYLVLLALVQALTEFLPISSSGHLGLMGFFFNEPYQGLTFDLALHLGTLIAVVVYFRRDLAVLARALLGFRGMAHASVEQRLGLGLIVSTIPAALAGLAMPDAFVESLRDPRLIAINLIVFGVVLWLCERHGRAHLQTTDMGPARALGVGLAQVLALIPGTSRSGITMSAGMAMGLGRVEAARYAFLMSVPITALAAAHGAMNLVRGQHTLVASELALGASVSAVAGVAVIHFLLKVLRQVGTLPFVLYRIGLGALVLGLYYTRH
jgi:undecaprenyl-diphosphatase